MNKKIKIIEIFNVISNGEYEKLPLNIEVDGKKYNWDTLEHFYNRKDSDREDLLELARKYDTITFLDMIAEVLDDSVEDNTEEIEKYNGETFEQLGYEVGKMSIAIAKGLEKAIKEMRKDLKNE
mgnify:CR=1 FL=1